MGKSSNHDRRTQDRLHQVPSDASGRTRKATLAWLLAIVVLAPFELGARGCDNAIVGDDCASDSTSSKCADSGVGASGGRQGNSDAGVSNVCGGLKGIACSAGEFCSYPIEAACGAADRSGICQTRPGTCTLDYTPVCGCDGKTYGNACAAAKAGVSVRTQSACTTAANACGGLLGQGCDKGQFCNYAVEGQCGAADQTGTCTAIPSACTMIYDPVCGCDGKTYASPCAAASASVSVAAKGECSTAGGGGAGGAGGGGQSGTGQGGKGQGGQGGSGQAGLGGSGQAGLGGSGQAGLGGSGQAGLGGNGQAGQGAVCGGLLGSVCASGQYCDYSVAARCGAADQTGICAAIPGVCTEEYAPVCGCDGKTYSNRCQAATLGVSVAADGKCQGSSGKACGARLGDTCASGEFCLFSASAGCGRADGTGTCTVRPQACTKEYAPVCGCDGNTYSNSCMAQASGTSVDPSNLCPSGGGTCSGLVGAKCPTGQYCSYPETAQCGAADQTGTCTAVPGACTEQYDPVCGCDGKTYGNSCAAATAGQSVAARGVCK